MKTLLFALLTPVLLKTCDPGPEKIGTPPPPPPRHSDNGGGGSTSQGSSTDVPIDGGLGILLVAGAAYGVRRYRTNKKTK